MIKKLSIFLIFICTFAGSAYSIDYRYFEGTINKNLKIHMILYADNTNKLSGYYYYDKFVKNIRLESKNSFSDQSIKIDEYDMESGLNSGKFEGAIKEKVFKGIWFNPDSSIKYPFELNQVNMKNENFKWQGEWYSVSDLNSVVLNISNVTNNSFHFTLDAVNYGSVHGGNNGQIIGEGKIAGPYAIYAKDQFDCTVEFVLFNNTIFVTDSDECSRHAGMGVSFKGNLIPESEYIKKQSKKIDPLSFLETSILLNKNDAFKALVKEDYELFQYAFQHTTSVRENKELKIKIFTGNELGQTNLKTFSNGIIMIGENNLFWAAVTTFIKDVGDVILYYTNDTNSVQKLPCEIEEWKSEISINYGHELKVGYMNKPGLNW